MFTVMIAPFVPERALLECPTVEFEAFRLVGDQIRFLQRKWTLRDGG